MWMIEKSVNCRVVEVMSWEFETKAEAESFILRLEEIRSKVPTTFRPVEIVED